MYFILPQYLSLKKYAYEVISITLSLLLKSVRHTKAHSVPRHKVQGEGAHIIEAS